MARIPQAKIDEIISSAEISTFISRYVALKKSGKNLKGLCPFHTEKTPSFMVSPEKQIYHCFGCGKGGNVVGFLMDFEKLSFIDAVRKIAFELGIKLPETYSEEDAQQKSQYDLLYDANRRAKDFFVGQLSLPENRKAAEYLRSRQLKKGTIKRFEVGVAPKKWDALLNSRKHSADDLKTLSDLGIIQKKDKGTGYFDKFRNRLIFPFHNTSGRIVGFGGRRLDENDQPKYLNSPESAIYRKGEILYGLFQAGQKIREKNLAILVEGYFDLLRLVDSGIENVVASSGTAISADQGRLIKRYSNNVAIAYDSDDAGINAAIRNSQILEAIDLNVSILRLPHPHDPDSFILQEGADAFYDLIRQKSSPVEFRIGQFNLAHKDAPLEEKNVFIDQVFEELIDIPNDVKIGLYIHQIAVRLQVQESLLISRFNQLKKQKKYRKPVAVPEKSPAEKPRPVLRKGQWQAEEGVLALLLLNDKSISNQILHQVSASDFVNDGYRMVFEQISIDIEEHGEVDPAALKKKFETEQLNHILLTDTNNPEKLAADCIYKMRKWSLDSRFNEIKRLISDEASSPESVLHYMKELNELRNKLTDIEKEREKHIKTNI